MSILKYKIKTECNPGLLYTGLRYVCLYILLKDKKLARLKKAFKANFYIDHPISERKRGWFISLGIVFIYIYTKPGE